MIIMAAIRTRKGERVEPQLGKLPKNIRIYLKANGTSIFNKEKYSIGVTGLYGLARDWSKASIIEVSLDCQTTDQYGQLSRQRSRFYHHYIRGLRRPCQTVLKTLWSSYKFLIMAIVTDYRVFKISHNISNIQTKTPKEHNSWEKG